MYAVRMPVQVLYERWANLDQQESVMTQTIIDGVRNAQYSCWKSPCLGIRNLRLRPDFSTSNGKPLQCSCLENPRDGGAWWAAVYGVAQSRTRLKRLCSSSKPLSCWAIDYISHLYIWDSLAHAFLAKMLWVSTGVTHSKSPLCSSHSDGSQG